MVREDRSRLMVDNACYHIIAMGNQKKAIFKAAEDYNKYIKLLSIYKKRYKGNIYGWCLMKNHVHLIIESKQLSKIMHGINLSYAQYFNYNYKTVGHLWQNRYKSFVIEKGKYLLNCITYIEYNPIRAGLISNPEDYLWSSYKSRVLGKYGQLLDPIVL